MVYRIFIFLILFGSAVWAAAEEKTLVENTPTSLIPATATPTALPRVIIEDSLEEDGLIAEDIPSGDPLKLSHYDEDLAALKNSRFTPGVDELLTATPTMTPTVEPIKSAYSPKPTVGASQTATATPTFTPTSLETPRVH